MGIGSAQIYGIGEGECVCVCVCERERERERERDRVFPPYLPSGVFHQELTREFSNLEGPFQ